MIYTLDGTPMNVALKAAAERAYWQRDRERRGRPQNYVMARDADGKVGRAFKIERDCKGDIMRIFRAAPMHRPGAGFVARQQKPVNPVPSHLRAHLNRPELAPEITLLAKIVALMGSGMSQRATARTLGIHLSKLQRTLAKGQLAAA